MNFEYIIKRLFLASVTLTVILLASYVLLRLAPGDPTQSDMLNSGEAGNAVSAEKGGLRTNSALREKLHLDRPVLTGFFFWMSNVLKGDFGESAAVDPGRPVLDLIAERLPVTLKLNIFAILLTYLLAIPIGVYTAGYADSKVDQVTGFILFGLYSLPVMWVGLLLQALFCSGGVWELFPLKGLTPDNSSRLSIWQLHWELLKCYALPVLSLRLRRISTSVCWLTMLTVSVLWVLAVVVQQLTLVLLMVLTYCSILSQNQWQVSAHL